MDTASLAHPCALLSIVLSVPYKGKHNIYLFIVEFPIVDFYRIGTAYWPIGALCQYAATSVDNTNEQLFSYNSLWQYWSKTW